MHKFYFVILCFFTAFEGNGQNIGINNANPIYPLSFADFKDELPVYGNRILFSGIGSQPHAGIGIQFQKLQFYTADPTHHFRFGTGNATNFSEVFRIRGNGFMSVNTNASPLNALEVKGTISLSDWNIESTGSLNYFRITGIGHGIYFNESSNTSAKAVLGILRFRDVLADNSDVDIKGVGIAGINPNPALLFAMDINHGGLILNYRNGITGQVMRSGGPSTPAFWSSSPEIEMYDKSGTACENLFSTISGSQTNTILQGLNYSPVLDRFAKVLFQTNIKVTSNACFACAASVMELSILQNGSPIRVYRYTIPNGTNKLLNTATMLDLLPGSPTISVELAWISGPEMTINADYQCRSVKYIPEM
jgi:hypothetical protein